MFYPVLPKEIKECIVSFIRPAKFTPEGVKLCGRIVMGFLGDSLQLQTLKQIYCLVLEYSNYNHHAENPKMFWNRIRSKPDSISMSPFSQVSPQLFAALSRGHWLFDRNHRRHLYTEKLEKDIKELVRLVPESLNFVFGDSSIHGCLMTPLSIACINEKIPLHMIEFLIKNGASLQVSCKATKQMVHLKNHLDLGSMNGKRLEGLLKILE